MKKNITLFALIASIFFYGQTLHAAAVTSSLNLTINCDKKCQDDALVLFRFKGTLTETLHKNINLVNESNANVTCAGFNLDLNKQVTVQPTPTTGEWFVTGGSYDSPLSDGILYAIPDDTRFYIGTSVPSDSNTVVVASQNPSIVSCSNGVCRAVGAGSTDITLTFPTTNQTANLPVEERNKWGTFNTRGIYTQYELEGTNLGYGKILFMAEYNNGSNLRRSNPIIMAYAFPSITCHVTVPPQSNVNHAVTCNALDMISDEGARVNWTYVDPENDTQNNFQIQVATTPHFTAASLVKNVVAPANTDISALRNSIISDLAANTQYYVRIRAHNSVNEWSNYSTCSGGFKTLPEGQCPAGQIRNIQGICENPPGGPCDGDEVCELNEGCACEDCEGDGDNCQVGLTCEYIATNPILSSCQPDCTASQVWNGTTCVTPQNGICGTANGKTYTKNDSGYGAYTQCTAGGSSLTAFPSPGNTARWVCRGIHGDDDSLECSASREQSDIPSAVCGGAAKSFDWNVASFGDIGFCQIGNPVSTVSFPSPGQTISWVCPGQSAVQNTTCFASRGQQPICGSYDSHALSGGEYPATTLSFPFGTGYCRGGTTGDTPLFPALGQSVTWQCSTSNGPDASCQAKRANNGDTDFCSNIAGTQASLPAGTYKSGTQCLCINGTTNPLECTTCPTGQTLVNGVCTTTGDTDICSNIAGTQASLPAGTYKNGTQCLCINGTTNPLECTTCPTGQTLVNGVCVNTGDTDFCSNIAGTQTSLPAGTYKNGTQCLCINGTTNPLECTTCPTGKVWNPTTQTCETSGECPSTQVPESIDVGAIPFIGCAATDIGSYFKYTLTGPQGYTYTSPAYALAASPVRHRDALSIEGRYDVTCFYGTSSSQTTRGCTDSAFDKSFRVVPNGSSCQGVSVYKEWTSNEVYTSQSSFNGSVYCAGGVGSANTPFSFKFGTGGWGAGIAADTSANIILSALMPGFTTSVAQSYPFVSGRTDVQCRVKSGQTYVTSASCERAVCVGGNCPNPQTFVVANSSNTVCTTSAELEYTIGCGAVDENAKAVCRSRFEEIYNSSNRTGTISGHPSGGRPPYYTVTCAPNSGLPAGVPMIYQNILCSVMLPTGQSASLYQGDFGGGQSAQTINHIASRDTTAPTAQFTTAQPSSWSKNPITVGVRCVNSAPDDGDACTCGEVQGSVPALDGNWATNTLSDSNIFTRTFSDDGRYTGTLQVKDNAGNISGGLSLNIGVDSTPPTVTVEKVSGKIKIVATDNVSGLKNTIFTEVIFNATQNNTVLNDAACLRSGSVSDIGVFSTTTNDGNVEPPSGQKIVYCISDNAGNVTRGQYPEVSVDYYGCFADGAMNPRPNLTNYTTPLIARIAGNIFGYSLSDSARATQNAKFQTRLTENINTYYCSTTPCMSGQYIADPLSSTTPATLTLDTTQVGGAKILSSNGPRNTNGYYYYSSTTGGRLNITTTNNIGSPKVIYVLGADVQINSNILTSSNGSVVIIARKFGNNGGNIYVVPSVRNISATLIADGTLMNREATNTPSLHWLTEDNRKKLDNNKLVINGRLFTYNSRGGSLYRGNNQLTGHAPDATDAKCFTSSTTASNCLGSASASQDLERFRLTTTAPTATDNQCTLYVTGTVPDDVPVLSGVLF